jgi:hypothetical protein
MKFHAGYGSTIAACVRFGKRSTGFGIKLASEKKQSGGLRTGFQDDGVTDPAGVGGEWVEPRGIESLTSALPVRL